MIKLIIILIFAVFVSIYTMFDFIVCSLIALFNQKIVRRHSVRVVKFIFRFVILVSGVKVYVAGLEHLKSLDNEKSYFAISNHRGFFDIITGYLLFDKDTGIIAKDSLGKIPILRYWMKRINCLFLNRHDLRDGMRMVLDAIKNINNGISMWVFPEGTRCQSKNPLELLEFKQGTFKIPEKTDSYILPIAFRNTEKAYEDQKPFLKSTDIYINIGAPYKISELNSNDNIAVYSQEIIKKLLAEENKWQRM